MVVATALQEDVDAIGVSILSGAHNTVFPAIIQLLKAQQLNHILLTGGGIIPEDDMKNYKKWVWVSCLVPVPTQVRLLHISSKW